MLHQHDLDNDIQHCLMALGIFRLSDWDVLSFIHSHGTSLASAAQIAALIGYENVVVDKALGRLEERSLLERSRYSRGTRLYRILAPTDLQRQSSLQRLLQIAKSRAGRLLLRNELKSGQSESGPEERSNSGHVNHKLEGKEHA